MTVETKKHWDFIKYIEKIVKHCSPSLRGRQVREGKLVR